MARGISPAIPLMAFFLVGVPIIVWILIESGLDRGYISDFIAYCASLLGVSRVGVSSYVSEILLIIAYIGGIATAILYIYEKIFSEEG